MNEQTLLKQDHVYFYGKGQGKLENEGYGKLVLTSFGLTFVPASYELWELRKDAIRSGCTRIQIPRKSPKAEEPLSTPPVERESIPTQALPVVSSGRFPTLSIPLKDLFHAEVETRVRKKGTRNDPATFLRRERYRVLVVFTQTSEGTEKMVFEMENPINAAEIIEHAVTECINENKKIP